MAITLGEKFELPQTRFLKNMVQRVEAGITKLKTLHFVLVAFATSADFSTATARQAALSSGNKCSRLAWDVFCVPPIF